MKKVLIILLSLLLLVSITSCNKDKSGEVIETFEEFANAGEICLQATSLINNGNVMKEDDETFVPKSDAKDLIVALDSKYKDLDYDNDLTLSNKTGKITKASGVTSYTGISVDYSFPFNGATVTGTLTVDGTYTLKEDGDITYITYDMTVNGTEYLVKYSYDDIGFLSASINGKEVNVRLLNSTLSIDD